MGDYDADTPTEPLTGSPSELADHLRAFEAAGCDHVQLVVDPITRDSIEWLADVLIDFRRPCRLRAVSAFAPRPPTFEDHVPDDYREPMRSLIVIVLTLTVFTAAGCSGDDDADPTTTRDPTTTVVETSEPDATVPSTTERSTTTSAPTTAAPTTTIDPTEALIADIEADLNAGEQALLAAGADPSNPELRAEVERYFAGAGLDRVARVLGRAGRRTDFVSTTESRRAERRSSSRAPSDRAIRRSRQSSMSAESTRRVVYEPLGDGAKRSSTTRSFEHDVEVRLSISRRRLGAAGATATAWNRPRMRPNAIVSRSQSRCSRVVPSGYRCTGLRVSRAGRWQRQPARHGHRDGFDGAGVLVCPVGERGAAVCVGGVDAG